MYGTLPSWNVNVQPITNFAHVVAFLLDCWFSVYVGGYPVGYAQVGELYELGGPGVESEGLVDVVFPDDALGVVVLEPGLPDVGQTDIHRAIRALQLLFPHILALSQS